MNIVLFLALVFSATTSLHSIGNFVIASIARKELLRLKKDYILRDIEAMLHKTGNLTPEPLFDRFSDKKGRFIECANYNRRLEVQKFTMMTPWRFTRRYFNFGFTEITKTFNDQNTFWALEAAVKSLKSDKPGKIDPNFARSLSFRTLISAISDLHSPMRNIVMRDTNDFVSGDDYGRDYYLLNHRTGKSYSVHDFWETNLGEWFGRSMTTPLKNEDYDYLDTFATKVLKTYPRENFKERLRQKNFKDWSKESFQAAMSQAYRLNFNGEDSETNNLYLKNAQTLISERIALAGYRLADLLLENFPDGIKTKCTKGDRYFICEYEDFK